jgi:CubicO group peptidase (beta-lactamase class C family)
LFPVAVCLLWSQVSPPDTAAGRRFGEWLEVFNRGDRAVSQPFFEKAFAGDAKQRTDRSLGMRQQTGGFDLVEVRESSATAIACILKSRSTGRSVLLTLTVEPEEPHRIATIRLQPAAGGPAPAPSAVSRLSESEAVAALRAELDRRAAQDRFSGAVLVAKGGKPLFAQAYGMADRENTVPNQLATKFRIGSMNKMFTATAVVQLAEAGKLQFTDPLGKFLPDYPNRDVASKVTIHHLLTHTGGTGDIFGPAFSQKRDSLRELKDYAALYGPRGLAFEPGAQWAYSNYGFVLLGLVIEKVSGQSYYDYVREHIFKPAGMASTDSYPESTRVAHRSIGYTKGEGGALRPNNDTLPPRGTSAGGGYSTVEDLLRFATAVVNHKLLNAQYTDVLTTGKVAGTVGKYAYGFSDVRQDGIRWFGHGGGAPGMNGDLRIYPDAGYVIAVLANLDPPAATEVSRFIAERLPAK